MGNFARKANRATLKKEFKALKKENPSLKNLSFSEFNKHVRAIKSSAQPAKAVENTEAEELLEDMFLEEELEVGDEQDTTTE